MSILNELMQEQTWIDFLKSVEEKPIGQDLMLIKNINRVIKQGVGNID